MVCLPDVVLHVILFRLQIPIELRAITIEDYSPFLPNEEGPVLSEHELLQFRDYLIPGNCLDRNIIDLGKVKYWIRIVVHDKVFNVKILKILTSYSYNVYVLSCSNNDSAYESLIPRHPDISFTWPHPFVVSLEFEHDKMTRENMKDIRREIVKWYRKIVYMELYDPGNFVSMFTINM